MKDVFLRPVEEKDVDLLFEWANDPDSRNNSLNTQAILYEEHVEWFNKIFSNHNALIYMLNVDGTDVGQVRLVVENKKAAISYSIAKKYRGLGYGKLILQLVENKLIDSNINVMLLTAIVKKNNIASRHIFERLNYVVVEEKNNEVLLFTKSIKNRNA